MMHKISTSTYIFVPVNEPLMLGFDVLQIPFNSPVLGSMNPEKLAPAALPDVLMLKLPDGSIKPEIKNRPVLTLLKRKQTHRENQ